MNLNKIMKIR